MPRKKPSDEFKHKLRALYQQFDKKRGGRPRALTKTTVNPTMAAQARVDQTMEPYWRELTRKHEHHTIKFTALLRDVSERLDWISPNTIRPFVINWLRRLPLTEQPHFLLNRHEPWVKRATKQNVAWLRRYVKDLTAVLKDVQQWSHPPQPHLCQVIQRLIDEATAADLNPYTPFTTRKPRSSPAK